MNLIPIKSMCVALFTVCNISSFGLLILELEHAFRASQFSLGWLMGVQQAVGFVIAYLLPHIYRRYSYRSVCLFASVLGMIGNVLSAWMPNVYCMYISYGVIIGAEIFIIDLTMFVILQEEVKVNIVFGTAVATSGFGIGDFLWPIVYKSLVGAYSWKGAFYVQGAIVLNQCALTLLLTSGIKSKNVFEKNSELRESSKERRIESEKLKEKSENAESASFDSNRNLEQQRQNNEKINCESENLKPLLDPEDHSANQSPLCGKASNLSKLTNSQEKSNSKQNLSDSTKKVDSEVAIKDGGAVTMTTSDAQRNAATATSDATWSRWDVIISVAFFLYNCGDAFGRFMIAVRLDQIGLPKHQIVIGMSAAGLAGLTRPLPSIIIDRCDFNKMKVAALLMFLIGGATMVSVTFVTFPPILVFLICFGFMRAAVQPILPRVFVEVFGASRTHRAMGCRGMGFTLSHLFSIPFCGLLLDIFHNINYPILLFGALQVIAAPLVLSLTLRKKHCH